MQEIEPGRLNLDLSSIGNTAVARHDALETIVGDSAASTVIHDQDIRNSETRLTADLGVTPWLGIALILPFRVFNTSIRYLDERGREVQIENPFIHHHNETLTGLGDPWLLGRVAFGASGVTFGARAGLTIPLGNTVEDPFALGDMGLPHEHTQFGTGTVQPVLSLDASRAFGPVHVDAFGLTVQSVYENGHGYQAGDRYAGGVGAASALGLERWRARATVEVQHETAERWHGAVNTEEGNIGRTDVIAGAEVIWRVTDDWHLSATAKVPVYQHVVGGQLDIPLFVGLSLGTHVHLWGDDEHAHGGAKTPPGDWSGLDEREIGDHGNAVPLVPVPGKITVVDFWATWCAPCRILDRELAEVVRRHPDDLAVRKLDVVETDSPASQKYLGAATLPHVKVFGRDGQLLWERSAPPRVLSSQIEALLSAPKPRAAVPASAPRIAIEVGERGFHPVTTEIPHGQAVVLVFTRTSDRTCAVDVHFTLPDGTRVDEELPLGKPVEIPLRVDHPGEIHYSCGMEMNHGTIVVK